MSKHFGLLILQLILITGLIILFTRINRLNEKIGRGEGAQYVKLLKILISKPISVAFIIAIFSSVLIYPYRPIMFMDISRILVTIPIVIVLTNILGSKYRLFAYVFGLSVVLYVFFLNLPANHFLGRLILFFVSGLLTGSLFYFLYLTKKEDVLIKNNMRFFTYIASLLLFMSITGFVANIIGKATLSTYLVEGVLGIVLVGIIISLLLVVVNGLTVLLINSSYGDKLNIIKNYKVETKRKITRFYNLVAIVMLIYFILDLFKIQGVIIDWFSEFLLAERNLGSLIFTWGNIFVFFIVIYLSIVIAGFIRALLEDDLLNKMNLKKGLPFTIALMVKYSLVTAGIFLAISAAGIPTTSLTVVLGAFGVGIGFGLQNIFNNLVSGLILLFERPIQIGDTIEVGALMGNVRSIGIRSSNVRTFDGAEIIVPNGNLISNEVVNWTLSDQFRRIEVLIGVSYNSDPHKVHDILLTVVKNHKDVLEDPSPNVFFKELGESSLDFRILCWTPQFDQWIRIKSELIFMAFDALKEAKIEIPFPQRDLHIRSIEQSLEIKK